MYCKVVQHDDNNITERCLKDTDGTLIFVGPRLNFDVIAYAKLDNTDWFIRRNRR